MKDDQELFDEDSGCSSMDGQENSVRFNVREGVGIPNIEVDTLKPQRRASKLNIDLLKVAFQGLGQSTPSRASYARDKYINISFRNLTYCVKQGWKRDTKVILQGLQGSFRAGELTAVMGPSGTGKSSLLDVLAGYSTMGVTGSILTNDTDRNLNQFSKSSCYIMQSEQLHPLLTVHEAMTAAIHLKLGSQVKHKQERVTQILNSLGLSHCKKIMTSNLSGGQRKRLAIALELVSNPPVMFFDEPTSGLDSSTSMQCLSLLKALAQEGRTIVITIHQPSALLFELFDHLYVLSGGSCIYSGGTNELVPFLASQGLNCPPYHNPADFLLEVASMVEYSNSVSKLQLAMQNGLCDVWRKEPVPLTPRIQAGSLFPNYISCASPKVPTLSTIFESQSQNLTTKKCEKEERTNHYRASFGKQIRVLIVRDFKKLWRDKFFTQLKLLIHVISGLFIGLMYYDIGGDAAFIFDNFSLLFFSLMFNMFTAFSTAVLTFPTELPILRREHFNRWYSLSSFYLAKGVSEMPVQILCTVIFCSSLYLLSSQPLDLGRYVMFIVIALQVGFISQSFGFLVGSSMSVQSACIFGPLVIMPFLIFSGFFVLLDDAPYFTKWLFHVSYLKYAFEGTLLSVYSDRERLECSDDYCHFVLPSKFLRQIGMLDGDYWFNFGILMCIIVLLRTLTYIILKIYIRFSKKT